MNNKTLKFAMALAGVVAAPLASATTDFSAGEYDLYAGDFDGDGKDDLLYVAKNPAKASGISLSDGSGPNTSWQSWASNYLGIPWSGNQYVILVADFNGDGKDDLLMQRTTAGDHYLLLTNSSSKISAIDQVIGNAAFGSNLTLSADQHKLLARDFNNDGKADLFLQAVSASGLHAVVYANSSGAFTNGSTQTWNDGYLGLNWSSQKANVYAGDFNGDHYADLLVQAKPKFVMIDYDVPFPVPTYPSNMNGVAYSQGAATPFQLAGVQTWSRNTFGVDWSPITTRVVIGSFNGDGRTDVLLQGFSTGKPSYWLAGNASGSAFANGSLMASNVTWTGDAYNLIVANFSGASGGSGVYFQGLTAATPNLYAASVTGSSVSTTAMTPVMAVEVIEYTYDALGRMTVVNRTGAASTNLQTTYNFDAAGNRSSVTTIPSP